MGENRRIWILSREHKKENNDLISKERKLKRKNFFSNLIIVILIIVVFAVAKDGFNGKRDSWFFKDFMNIESTESTEVEELDVDETASSKFIFKNLVEGGYTKYIITNAESNWGIFDSGLLSDESEPVEVDLANSLGVGDTKVIITTEYYGGFGNLVDSKSVEKTIHVE